LLIFLTTPWVPRKCLTAIHRWWQWKTCRTIGPVGGIWQPRIRQITEDAAWSWLLKTSQKVLGFLRKLFSCNELNFNMSMQGVAVLVPSLTYRAAIQINKMWYVQLLGRMVL
jgi:hypothetical protein